MPGRPFARRVAGLGALACVALAACTPSAAKPSPSTTPTSSPASTAAATPTPSAASSPSTSASASPTATPANLDPEFVPALSAMQMVGPHAGWAVGAYAIFATSDGIHWTKQLASTEQFVFVDFISATTGWAVGVRTLLGTTDGGKTWRQLGEGPKPIRSVHFISPSEGWGIMGGGNPQMDHGWLIPSYAGNVVKTNDGGQSWQIMDSPVDAQSICFSDAAHGWLATASGNVYLSADGGDSWTKSLTTVQNTQGEAQTDRIECAAPSAAWLTATLPGAAMSHRPYVVYATEDGRNWRTVMTEPYTTGSLLPGVPAGPDSYPPSFSVVDPMDAVFVGDGPATMVGQCVIASNGGASLRRTGSIANSSETFGAAFVSVTTGWVLTRNAGGDYVIDATADGGYHWSQQLAVAPSSAG